MSRVVIDYRVRKIAESIQNQLKSYDDVAWKTKGKLPYTLHSGVKKHHRCAYCQDSIFAVLIPSLPPLRRDLAISPGEESRCFFLSTGISAPVQDCIGLYKCAPVRSF